MGRRVASRRALVISGCLVALCLFVVAPRISRGDTLIHVFPYTMSTEDGQFVFAMINVGTGDEPSELSGRFPRSGLYSRADSTNPLWTVDWSGYVWLPSDSVHLVRRTLSLRQTRGYQEEALAFFADGRLLRTYRICDLVDFPFLLPHTSMYYTWMEPMHGNDELVSSISYAGGQVQRQFEGVLVHNDGSTLELKTIEGGSYVFDLNTGGIVNSHRPLRLAMTIGLCSFALLYGAYLLIATARKGRDHRNVAKTGLFRISVCLGIAAVVVYAVNYLYESNPDGATAVLVAAWRAIVYLPVYLAEGLGWIPRDGYWVILSIGFWFLILLALTMLNAGVVRAVALLRKGLLPTGAKNRAGNGP